MSTYTDLHNRVQESINVDYSSRITPQKVIFTNGENEYWGTFKGTMQADSIDVNGGTLSGVKLKDVSIEGATFNGVDGLNIDLDDYMLKEEFVPWQQNIDHALTKADAARDTAVAVSSQLTDLNHRVDYILTDVDRRVDNKLDVYTGQVTNSFANISDVMIPNIKGELELSVRNIAIQVESKDNYNDRIGSEITLSNNLTNLIQSTSGDVTSLMSSTSSIIEQDLHQLSNEEYATSTFLSGKILTVSSDLSAEQTNRINQDNALLNRINAVYDADLNTGTVVDVSAELYRQLTVESSIRARDDGIISSDLTNLCALHNAEVENRGYADAHLCSLISTLCADSQTADSEILETINQTSTTLDNKIDKTSSDVLDELEYKRHYILNSGRYGHAVADVFPFVAKDMAVNIFDVDVPDAKLQWYNASNNKEIDIARVYVVNDTVKVKTYAELSDRHEGISKALADNHPYDFTRISREIETKNGYTFEYKPPADLDKLLSVGKLFELHATQLSYYNLFLSGTQNIIGKVYATSCTDNNTIVSGQYDIEVQPTSELCSFNYFKAVPFDLGNTSYTCDGTTERITYQTQTGNAFKLELGVHNVPYFDVLDNISATFMFRVYQKSGNEDGITFDENDQITAIRINDIEDDITRYAYLNTNNNFSTVISTYVNFNNGRTYNRYIDASIDTENNQIIFKKYDAARLNKYPFEFTSFDGTDTQMTGYVVPILYNRTIDEALDVGKIFQHVEVDMSNVVTVDRLKTKYMLEKVPHKAKWTYHGVKDGAVIDIVYSDYNILSVHYTVNDDETEDNAYQQNDFTHVLNVSRTPIDDDFAGDPEAIVNLLSSTIELDRTFLNEELEPVQTRDYVEKTYYATFDPGDMQETSLVPYNLDVVLDGMNNIQIQVPTKIDYSPNYQVSREFLLVLRFKSNVFDQVNVTLIKDDGFPAKFYNNKKQIIQLPTNQWTTLQINEVQDGKYLVTDLNQNEDWLRFSELCSTLSTEIKTRTEQVDYLSDQLSSTQMSVYNNISDIAWLSGELSDTVRYKGTVQLKDDYNADDAHPIDPHCHLSMLLSTCDKVDAEVALENGYMFRCVTDAANIKKTFEFEEDDSGTKLSLDNNDYIILTDDMMLSDARISDVVVIKDFSNYIERLSVASDEKYVMLSGNNSISGDNSISNLTANSLSAVSYVGDDSQISNLSTIDLSATKIVVDDIYATKTLSATSATIINSSVSALSVDDISAKTFVNLTGNVSSFTAESAYMSAVSATTLSADSNTDVSAYISNLTVNKSYIDDLSVTNVSAANLSATTLSVDGISATKLSVDDISATKLSVDGLSGTNLSVENLSVTKLSVDGISATKLSVDGLSGINLSVENLSVTKLSVADLSGTNLSVENLSVTKLSVADLSGTNLSVENLSVTKLSVDDISATKLSVDDLSGTDLSVENLSGTNLSVENLSVTKLSVDDISATKLSADSLSATKLSVASLSGTDLSIAKLSTTDLSVANLSGTNLSIEKLSGTDISTTNLTTISLVGTSACISSLSVNALSTIIDNNTTSTLQDTISDLNRRLNTVSGHVDDALSTECILPSHSVQDNVPLTAIVSKLLLVDEVTYDVYALTMRNGTLNVDKLGAWPDAHQHPHPKPTT